MTPPRPAADAATPKNAHHNARRHAVDASPTSRKPRRHRGRGQSRPTASNGQPRSRAAEPDLLDGLDVAPAIDPNAPTPGWADLGLPAKLVQALLQDGLTEPFPIQAHTLPDALAGRDLLGRGRTGSGKTLGFGLPVLTRLAAENKRAQSRRPRALILVPTRELAAQVDAALAPLGQSLRLRTRTVVGGVGYGKQISALSQGVDVLVATPGRLTDLVEQGHCDLSATGIVVLDEADQMCDMGFLPAVRRLLALCAPGQRLLFSATLDRQVSGLVREYLTNPVVHALSTGADPVASMEHHLLSVSGSDKAAVVRTLAQRTGRTLLFVRTKHGADRLAKQLTRDGIPSGALHGNLNQNARTRALSAFADGSVSVLVATDVAARGIHVDDIELVVHVDPPTEHKTYLHRSGRTARAGASGRVVTLALPDQAAAVRNLLRLASVRVEAVPTAPTDQHLAELRGEAADLVVVREIRTESRQAGRGPGRVGRAGGERRGRRAQHVSGGQQVSGGQRRSG
ncbi:MAG TPA: DEAD/DEAH box helicase [Mycobacteriales bacterium]|nr:DEAD/DEAH box helicase [Mycobacteriales bacterium]